MIKKIIFLLKLMRISSPTGYMASFFPAYFGLSLSNAPPDQFIRLVILFFIGSVITRGAGCIINDIFDKDFDKHVLRTKDRPLAAGQLTVKEALIFLMILLFCSLMILLSLSQSAIYLGLVAFIMIILYPLMKRIIEVPQVFLGLVFNFGALIGNSAVTDKVSLEALIMYIACVFWTIGYDTIYGFMDLQDDKKIQVKSMSILLETKNYRLHLYLYYTLFIILFYLANIIAAKQPNYIALLVAYALLIWQVTTLQISNSANCLIRFKNTNYVGIILALGYLMDSVTYRLT